ncbi:TspO and MBR s [Mycobacterium sp. ST-F2]|uniref:TspO/MBR family protein n=1 Tax=Mycobacterium sp. ST-F2 TaxID=1490484 RepID=UPI00093B873C|nr:TspO/MBR family protein [Mycobacterium sp. ST-F2]OKH80111.1 TspO and MBR s [Mycobacterium sp. ST-F2]
MRITTLLITGFATAATAALGGMATAPAVRSNWYAALRKPAYQPPREVFPVVWPALYADIAVVSAAAIDELGATGRDIERRAYRNALALNLALNAAWSWLFFNRRRLGTATVVSAALTVSSADMTRRAVNATGGRAAPLALYPLWCAFATVLCGHIRQLNSRAVRP